MGTKHATPPILFDTHNSAKVSVNKEALGLLGDVHDALIDVQYDKGDIQMFLMRFLFCLFADDTGVWERGLFKDWLKENTKNGASPKFNGLHAALDTAQDLRHRQGIVGFDEFPYINGGLFGGSIRELTTTGSTVTDALLAAATGFDWSSIGPVIFGSMFQTIAGDRSERGKHYTSEEDILKVLRPLFVDEYEKKIEACRGDKSQLQRLQVELGTLQFFDQAAGCGNFLIVAYQELRRLETEILRQLFAGRTGTLLSGDERNVFINQFFGVEYEPFAAEIAKTGFYLADHLANMALADTIGQKFNEYPIQHNPNIIGGQDSLLTKDGNRPFDWAKFLEEYKSKDDIPVYKKDGPLYIVGNPPYKGSTRLSLDQSKGLRMTWGTSFSGHLDYVTAWFKKSVELMETRGPGVVTKAGLVATSSITQGNQPAPLWDGLRKTAKNVGIDFAYQPFMWKSDETHPAGVSVVIIGFSVNPDRSPNRRLWLSDGTETVTKIGIDPYLGDGSDSLFVPAKEFQPEWVRKYPLRIGSMTYDGGGLLIKTKDERDKVLEDNALPAEFVYEFLGAEDLISGKPRWCLWLKNSTPNQRSNSSVIRKRMDQVSKKRGSSPSLTTRRAAGTPYLFLTDTQPTEKFLAVPKVSSGNREVIPMRYLEPDHIVSNKLFTISGCPVVLFGVLQSQMFTVWQDTIGGRLKEDRSMSTYVYDSFPFLPLDRLTKVETAAAKLLALQESLLADGNTLADLHKKGNMAPNLLKAYKELDEVVDAAYGLTGPETVRTSARWGVLVGAYQNMVSAGRLDLNGRARSKKR